MPGSHQLFEVPRQRQVIDRPCRRAVLSALYRRYSHPRLVAFTPAWNLLTASSLSIRLDIMRLTVRGETESVRAAASSVSPAAARARSARSVGVQPLESGRGGAPKGVPADQHCSNSARRAVTMPGLRISSAPARGSRDRRG